MKLEVSSFIPGGINDEAAGIIDQTKSMIDDTAGMIDHTAGFIDEAERIIHDALCFIDDTRGILELSSWLRREDAREGDERHLLSRVGAFMNKPHA